MPDEAQRHRHGRHRADDRHGPHGRHGPGRGGPGHWGGPRDRPPWWPDTEPWPPADGGAAWRRVRGRFVRRVVGFGIVLLVVLVALVAVAVWLGTLLAGGSASAVVPGLIVLLLLGLAARSVVRAIRSSALPAADLIEAAGRVEAGDYAVRVAGTSGDLGRLAGAFNAMAARLEANDEERRRLLADVSHELRTPLAVIQGNLEGIIDGVYPADAEHLAPILDETQVLERLIDDLRTLSLSESGVLRLDRQPTDVGELLHEVAASFGGQADSAEVALDVDVGEGLPALDVDPARLRQVVSNLVSNALRHTDPGGRVELAAAPQAAAGLTLTVTDNGRGMDAEQVARMFDRFYRSPDSPGSGLGLAIVRNLVVAHGGEVSATSEPGRGTQVRVSLPPG